MHGMNQRLFNFYISALNDENCDQELVRAAWDWSVATRTEVVMVAVARRPHLAEDIQASVAACKLASVRIAYLKRGELTGAQLAHAIGKETRVSVLETVAYSDECPTEVLDAISAHSSDRVKFAVLSNANVSDVTFKRLLVDLSGHFAKLTYDMRTKIIRTVIDTPRMHRFVVTETEAPELLMRVLASANLTDGELATALRRKVLDGYVPRMGRFEIAAIVSNPNARQQALEALEALVAKLPIWDSQSLVEAIKIRRAELGEGANSPEDIIPAVDDPEVLDSYLPLARQSARIATLLAQNPATAPRTRAALISERLIVDQVMFDMVLAQRDDTELIDIMLTTWPASVDWAMVNVFANDPDAACSHVFGRLEDNPAWEAVLVWMMRSNAVPLARVGELPWALATTAASTPKDIVMAVRGHISAAFADRDPAVVRRRWSRFSELADRFTATVDDLCAVCVATS